MRKSRNSSNYSTTSKSVRLRALEDRKMVKHRIVLNMSSDAAIKLAELALADNCTEGAIVEHLVMGRMIVKDGHAVVSELAFAEHE